MKFALERDMLAEAVTWTARGLPSRPPVPVLAGVLIEAEADGSVTLSAFDYEVSSRITVAAEVSEPGTVLVLGKLLADISRQLPHKTVVFATDGNRVTISCGSTRFALLQMPTDEYPTLPTPPEPSGTIAGDVFTQAVAQVSVAADRTGTLPILTAVRVEVAGDKITLLATDRYRLATREIAWTPDSADNDGVVLVSARTLSDTAKSLGAAGPVGLALGAAAGGDGLVGIEAGRRRTTTRLLDGDYPKVGSIFPAASDSEAVLSTAALIEAVKRVSLVAELHHPVRLRVSEGQMGIDAGAGDDAQASEALDCTLTGPELEIAFNPHYLLDGLQALGTPYCRLSFTQSNRPAVLTGQAEPDGDADSSYRYVLMPVRFGG